MSKSESLIDRIRKVRRAMQGLPLDDDKTIAIMKDDHRERTRLNEWEVYRHGYMLELAQIGGEEWQIFAEIAEIEDIYLISLNGEQRKEAILMQKAKTELPQQNLTLAMPNVSTKPEEQKPEEKKRFFRK